MVTSDASGSWGCAAWSDTMWLQLKWDDRAAQFSIMVKEMIPITLAAAIWGQRWRGHQVTCRCDNQAVVASLNSRSSPVAHVMHMLRCLSFIEAHFGMALTATYISTGDNYIADDLSRNKMASFRSEQPQANPEPTPIPPSLPTLLFDPLMDWVDPAWTSLFSAIFSAA